MIIVYVANKEKYSKGFLLSKSLKLPISDEDLTEVQADLEFTTTDSLYMLTYLCDLPFVRIPKYYNLEQLNSLAKLLQEASKQCDLDILQKCFETSIDLGSAIASYCLFKLI